MKQDFKAKNPRYLKTMYTSIDIPFNGLENDNTVQMQMYLGPNSLKIMDSYGLDLSKQIPLGGKLVGWINRYLVVNVFNWLGSYGWNYGIVILVLTIIIKLILMPFAYKSYQSTAKMRVLKPEIDAIGEKYPKPEDAMKKQQAVMDLYKKAGASPTSDVCRCCCSSRYCGPSSVSSLQVLSFVSSRSCGPTTSRHTTASSICRSTSRSTATTSVCLRC